MHPPPHNPSHDNGYKVYFEDGAQIVSPHAEGIVGEVNLVSLDETGDYLEKDLIRDIEADAAQRAEGT